MYILYFFLVQRRGLVLNVKLDMDYFNFYMLIFEMVRSLFNYYFFKKKFIYYCNLQKMVVDQYMKGVWIVKYCKLEDQF